MAAVSTRVSPLLAAALLAMHLGAPPLAAANLLQEVPVHHDGGPAMDHRDLRDRHLYQPSYQQPSNYIDRQTYGAPAAGGYLAQEDTSDLLTYILPALAITGLSLLFPNVVTINTTGRRRRRDAEDSSSPTAGAPMDDLVEHLTNIYYAATESDECIQRIACEIGATAKSMKTGNKELMMSILGKAATNKYSKLFNRFKDGANTANCKKIGCKLID